MKPKILGTVGPFEISWNPIPQGNEGTSEVTVYVNGSEVKRTPVRWIKDSQRILIELNEGYVDFEVRRNLTEDGLVNYGLVGRNRNEWISDLKFLKHGEENAGGAAGASKKSYRVRAQMPGKIVRVLVKPGDLVQAGQSLLVMEAMKMENEIKAQEQLIVQDVKVSVGQAVESGADLVILKKG